jgi:murein DD-endopeptidase MepM/ murein hydrolase activator NlpD
MKPGGWWSFFVLVLVGAAWWPVSPVGSEARARVFPSVNGAVDVMSLVRAEPALDLLPSALTPREESARDRGEQAKKEPEGPRLGPHALLFPVEGGPRKPIKNSFRDRRSGGRTHKAIDVFAPRGTPLLAAVDGFVKKKHHNRLGGITLYLVTEDGSHTLMYAHLSRFAPGLEEGQAVTRGDLVGFVGDTGNAKGHPHLHLAIYEVVEGARWWEGKPVNPFPLLAPLVDASLVLAPAVTF